MKVSGVYKIQSNVKSNRIYIGSAVNIRKRWGHHLSDLRRNKHGNGKLQNHYNKYGESDLQFSILLGCEKSDLLKAEQYFIDSYKPFFNINPIAGSNLGRIFSEETRKKNSESHKGITSGNKGNKYSVESRKKVSLSLLGSKRHCKPHTEETKQKIRDARKLQITSDETRLKISISRIGYKHSEEAMQKMRGRKLSEETKKKLSESHKGKVMSVETRKKMSESKIKYHQLKNSA